MNSSNPKKTVSKPMGKPAPKFSAEMVDKVLAEEDAYWAKRNADPKYPKTKVIWPE